MSNALQPLPEIATEGGEIIEQVTPSASAMIKRAELEAMILMAKRHPRNITRFLNETLSIATLNQAVAKTCYYRKPQDKGFVEGPSIRLAEIAASRYGNLWTTSRIVHESHSFIVAQAETIDLETITAWQSEVRRRITRRDGSRYGDDQIINTCNAAISIASRNVVLRAIPRALIDTIWQECRVIAGGKGESVEVLRGKWMAWAREAGIKDEELYAALGIGGYDDFGLEQFSRLAGIQTAIQDGETTFEAVFRPQQAIEHAPAAEVPAMPKGDRLAESLKTRQKNGKGQQAGAAAGDLWPEGRE